MCPKFGVHNVNIWYKLVISDTYYLKVYNVILILIMYFLLIVVIYVYKCRNIIFDLLSNESAYTQKSIIVMALCKCPESKMVYYANEKKRN